MIRKHRSARLGFNFYKKLITDNKKFFVKKRQHMSFELIITIFFIILAMYLLIGLVFAIGFVNKGAGKIDDSAKEMPLAVKLLIFPASVALWFVLWQKTRK